jgi:hypothetical protein
MSFSGFCLDAMELLEACSERSRSPEGKESFLVATAAVTLIFDSGQVYPLEEFRKERIAEHARTASLARAVALLERTRAEVSSPQEKEILLTVIDALDFIESAGMLEDLEDCLHRWEIDTLPAAFAAFKSFEEAEAWLNGQSPPPRGAKILIGDEYFGVLRSRDSMEPGFDFIPMEYPEIFIARHTLEGPPPVEASFATRAEAEAWLASHPEAPPHCYLMVGGEHCLAVYQKKFNHRAIYPFSLAARWIERMREP